MILGCAICHGSQKTMTGQPCPFCQGTPQHRESSLIELTQRVKYLEDTMVLVEKYFSTTSVFEKDSLVKELKNSFRRYREQRTAKVG